MIDFLLDEVLLPVIVLSRANIGSDSAQSIVLSCESDVTAAVVLPSLMLNACSEQCTINIHVAGAPIELS